MSPWGIGGTLALAVHNPWDDATIPIAVASAAVLLLVCVVMFYHPRHGSNIDATVQALSRNLLPACVHQHASISACTMSYDHSLRCDSFLGIFT